MVICIIDNLLGAPFRSAKELTNTTNLEVKIAGYLGRLRIQVGLAVT